MRLRPLCVVVLMALLVPTHGWASDHVASMFGGYSELYASREKGLHFGLEVSWPTAHHKVHDHLGIVVDAAVHGGTDAAGDKFTKTAGLIGLRGLYKLPRVPWLVLYAHGLIGGHRSQTGLSVANGWAGGGGGGVEVQIANTTHGGWALRGQVDWLRIAGETSPRSSFGVGFRFK